jgi:gamma-glutamylcyclotransferase (GGCT)/AIG2-like uncharacterized protein YtfP
VASRHCLHGVQNRRLTGWVSSACPPRLPSAAPARTLAPVTTSSTNREIVLFVCDSLMQGEPHHDKLGSARALGKATTTAAYDLVDLGASGALVAGGQTAVAGELYALTLPDLAALDILRGHPVLHQRAPVTLADGRVADAYHVGSQQSAGRRRVPSGDWRTRRGATGVVGGRDAGALVRWAKRRF